ncbi:unnamed protein product [Cylindrotheca closterium]|uniref:Uncharacterized protein n=1 Tax=Cylindrotheca closterium TaxID=2856 RepID=A0AAD2CGJ0_9STRA|nr:unnamed protein product [Cylindrotheca closterium]
MPDANMSEPVPAAHVVTPQRNGGQNVAPTRVPFVNATAAAAAPAGAAPPLASVRTRHELIIKRGIYKGKRGYLDESRGHGGYSPTRKSVYITYIDEDGVEKIASHCVRSTSITLVNWSTPLNSTNPILQRHPELMREILSNGVLDPPAE